MLVTGWFAEDFTLAELRTLRARERLPGLRPQSRPEGLPMKAAFRAAPPATAIAPAVQAMTSPRPAPRPRNLAARAAPRAPKPQAEVVQLAAAPRVRPGDALVTPRPGKGGLCGDPGIEGAVLPPITGAVAGCGVANPVRVTAVDGVRLSTPATLDCDTARALRTWVTKGLKPAAGRTGVAEIRVAAHYACRPRNNVRGARISEHGRGKAIDIAGIRLGNGQMLSVLADYRRTDLLQKVRRAACGIFGTTLGPGSDRHHSDHFHFDTARHRNGPYCR
ncbi:MAG TPA: extensin family protein [Paracoccaceae bacterium]|nr:extensin family protein [Paracoccaceae bacterium]